MWKLTLSGIWARKRRLVSTALAIVAGVAFMTGSFMLTDTMAATFDDLFANAYDRAAVVVQHHQEVGAGFSARPERLDGATVDRVAAVPGVAHVAGYLAGYFQLVTASGTAIGGSGGPNPEGFAWIDDPALNAYRIIEGRAPVAPDEIAIDRNSALTGHFHVGDRVRTLSSGPATEHTVVGITRFGRADSAGGLSVSALSPAGAEAIFAAAGNVDQILVRAEEGVADSELAERIAGALNDESLEVVTGRALAARQANLIKDRLGRFTVALVGFAVVSLFVGMFIISNTFAILIAQRTRELALIRAIGARRRQVFGAVLAEGAAVGLLGSIAGLGLGALTAVGLRAAFAGLGINLPAAGLVLQPRTVVVAFLVGFGVTLLAAVAPARRASAVPPVAALAGSFHDRTANSRGRLALGGLLAVAAVGLAISGLAGDGNLRRVGLAGAAATGTAIALGPQLARRAGRLVGRPFPALFGTTGLLARENAVRNPRRTAATAGALMIGVALVTTVQVFVSSFEAQLSKAVEDQFSADFIVGNQSFIGFSPAIAERLREVDGVDRVAALRFGRARLEGDAVFVVSIDAAFVDGVVDLPIVEGRLADLGRGAVALGRDTAATHGWRLGDAVPITLPATGPTTLRLAALLDDGRLRTITRGGDVLIDTTTYDDGYTEHLDFQLFVKAAAGADITRLTADLRAALAPYPTAKLNDPVQYKRSVEGQLRQFVSIIYLLLALSVLIAVIGIANTLTLSIHERTREIGLLRAVGAHRRQIRTTIGLESVIMAVLGALLGLVLGVAFGVAVMRALRSEGFTEIVVPWPLLAVIAAAAAVLGLLAALRPARRAARLDVLAAIGTE